jgi:hypothetical protein
MRLAFLAIYQTPLPMHVKSPDPLSWERLTLYGINNVKPSWQAHRPVFTNSAVELSSRPKVHVHCIHDAVRIGVLG